jgi:hypothetical protein
MNNDLYKNTYLDKNQNKIKFMESHVGGNLNDTIEEYKNQKKIIDNSTDDYLKLINYYTKEERTQSYDDENFIKNKIRDLQSLDARINNIPTVVNDVNISNPTIYPKEYDPYFEYLNNKNLYNINNRVIKNKVYVNIDSSLRNLSDSMVVDKYYMLENNSLVFADKSSTLKILINNANRIFNVDDQITIRGYKYYTINYSNTKFYFKNRSDVVIIDIQPNYTVELPYYDIQIKISNVTYKNTNFYKNIPLNIINQLVSVKLYNDGDGNFKFQFIMPQTFYTDNDDDHFIVSDCSVTYYNVGNLPIGLVNAALPLSEYSMTGYLLVTSVSNDYIIVNLNNEVSLNSNITIPNSQWIGNDFYTGTNKIEIGKITNILKASSSQSSYSINLEKELTNIVSIRMISSEIPNTYKNIFGVNINLKNGNNLFYWQNYYEDSINSITIPTGYYTYEDLATTMEKLINETPRTLVQYSNNYNNFSITLNYQTNISTFKSYNIYKLPNCFQSIAQQDDNSYIITIVHETNNLKVGDMITISGAIDYYYISKNDINTEHQIYNIVNSNIYQILITNINIITNNLSTTTNTKNNGGYGITIKTNNSFRLLFNLPNTVGNIIGFVLVGTSAAITPYCSLNNNYTITNLESYQNDIQKIYILNNINYSKYGNTYDRNAIKYILLSCNSNLNKNSTPNGIKYFYKILLNNTPNTMMYNTFVDAPLTFISPIKSLSSLNFNFYTPGGSPFIFFNADHSFTLEITCISNYPENLPINTFTSKL